MFNILHGKIPTLIYKIIIRPDSVLNWKEIKTKLAMNLHTDQVVIDKTRKLVNEWYNICCNYHMIDDTPSIELNLPGNIEHRHDQSVFSLLTKKYNLFSSKSITPSCVLFTKKRY